MGFVIGRGTQNHPTLAFGYHIGLLVILDQMEILDSTHRQRLAFDMFFLCFITGGGIHIGQDDIGTVDHIIAHRPDF